MSFNSNNKWAFALIVGGKKRHENIWEPKREEGQSEHFNDGAICCQPSDLSTVTVYT